MSTGLKRKRIIESTYATKLSISFLQLVIFKAYRHGEHGKYIHVSAPWPKPTAVVRTCHQPNMCRAPLPFYDRVYWAPASIDITSFDSGAGIEP